MIEAELAMDGRGLGGVVNVRTTVFLNGGLADDRDDRIVRRTGDVDDQLARGRGILRVGDADVEVFLSQNILLGELLPRVQGFQQFGMGQGVLVRAVLVQFQHAVLALHDLHQLAVMLNAEAEIAGVVLGIRIVATSWPEMTVLPFSTSPSAVISLLTTPSTVKYGRSLVPWM